MVGVAPDDKQMKMTAGELQRFMLIIAYDTVVLVSGVGAYLLTNELLWIVGAGGLLAVTMPILLLNHFGKMKRDREAGRGGRMVE